MTKDAYPFTATFEFGLPEKTVGDLLKVLSPEGVGDGDRTSVGLKQEEGCLVLNMSSSDIKGLRAAMNSYLRWIECSLQVTELPK